jgi:RNA processing factor Prp31
MPLCGFNQKMIEGLEDFHEELVEHGILGRSTRKNQSIDTTIKNELNDMKRFIGEMNSIKDPKVRSIVRNLAKYANSFYELVNDRGIDNYKNTIRNISTLYFEMDKKFYGDLEGKSHDMKQLAQYLNNIRI